MWIIFSLVATLSQITRNLFSKKLVTELPTKAITISRFLFAIPVVFSAYFILGSRLGFVKVLSNHFYLWAVFMAISQVLATYFRVLLFKYKSFAVSLTIVQIDTILVAIIGVIFLKELLNFYSWIALIVVTIGLMLASLSKNRVNITNIKDTLFTKPSLIALLTGIFLALAAIFVKKTFNYIDGPNKVLESLFSLSIILVIEVLLLLPFLLRDRSVFVKLLSNPLKPAVIGFFSGVGSFCWLTAYSLTHIAYVRTVGQLEFIIASIISIYYLKEKIYKLEFLGILLVSLGTLTLMILKN